MTKFFYFYTGGTMPETQQGFKDMMEKWMAYFGKLGSHLVDGGSPLGKSTLVGGGKASGMNGYSIVEAKDLAHAKKLTDGHPHLGMDGHVEVIEILPMPGGKK